MRSTEVIRTSENLRGALFMVAAMAGFGLEDMFLKSAAAFLPVGEIVILFGLGGLVFFSGLAMYRGEPVLHPSMLAPSMLFRAMFESVGRIFYTLSIAVIPLSNASAILQATPLVVVAAAALLLGESVSWRRWAAILLGFAGVLMILRPGLSGFAPGSILAILGMLGFAGRDLATRMSPVALSYAQLGICGFAVLVPTGAIALAVTGGAVVPDLAALVRVGAGVLVGVGAYSALTMAMRTGEVSVVTPFRYSRLLFGVLLGMLIFGERPDAMTLSGSAVILAAGLYIMLGRSRARPQEGSG